MRAHAAFAAISGLALSALLLAAVLPATPARAQAQASKPAQKAAAPAVTRPTWKELTPAQREALAPLATEWDTLDTPRKRKWLEVAPKYHQLSPEGQQRMHARMKEFAKLTPEQRWTARENFQRAYELPADQRQSLIQQYRDLPADKKQQLNEKARARPEPTRRSERDGKGDSRSKPKPAEPARPAQSAPGARTP